MDYLSESRTSHGGGDLIASSSNFDLNDLGAGLGDAGLGNKSFQSMLSATSLTSGNASSSSKAVLAALRALQDKIRRLESERSQALDEVTQLRMQLKDQEIESEHQKQRDQLTTQKSLQDAKVSQERLQQEKTELEVRVQRMEDKIRLSQQSSEELQTKIRVLEDEKHSANLRIREMEHAHHQMEQQIKSAQIKEKGMYGPPPVHCYSHSYHDGPTVDMANTLIWETKHHEEEVTLLNHRVSSLQEELTKISHDKGALDGRIVELDQLVGQLLALNESLVAQLSGKPWRALTPSVPSTKKVKKTSSKKTSTSSNATAPRVASLSTVSADISRSLAKKPATKHVDVNDIDQLKSLHKAYAKMASSLTRSLSPSKSPSRAGRKASSHHDLSEMTHSAASLGTSRGSTRLSRKKKTATATASSSSSAYTAAEETTSRSTTPLSSSHTASVRIPKPNVSFDASQLDASSLGHAPSRSYLTTQQIDLSQLRTPATGGAAPSSSSYLSSPSSSPARATPPAEDLRAMINTLEDEFSDLNRQYRRLLSNVSAASTDVPESLNEQSIDARAQEIVKVIQKLHEKGEQLRVLKSPTK